MLDVEWPWLVLILPLPWVIRRFVADYKPNHTAVRVPFYDTICKLQKSENSQSDATLLKALSYLIWCTLVLAAIRPIWLGQPVTLNTTGRDLLLAVDLSDSMRIDDMLENGVYITRMQAIKKVAGDFITRRQGDRVGLIVFGQQSYLQSPLTFDRQSVATQLKESLPGFAGSSTAIGDAVGMGIRYLRDRPAKSRILIVLTDGANTAGTSPSDAMQVAADAGIRIHTIGIGALYKTVVDTTGMKRKSVISKDLDENMLQRMAKVTGGEYFRAHNPSDMELIYQSIDRLEPVLAQKTVRPQRSLYHLPLSASLFMYILVLGLRQRAMP